MNIEEFIEKEKIAFANQMDPECEEQKNDEFNFPGNTNIEEVAEAFFAGKINKDIKMSSFINDKGEMIEVILNQRDDDEEKSISFRTFQGNDWIRVDTYYENGVYIETYYERRK